MSFADRIAAARDFDPGRFLPFHVAGEHCGWVRPALAAELARWPAVFTIGAVSVELAASLKSPAERTAAVAEVVLALHKDGHIAGWRNETYPVAGDFATPPLFSMERAAARVFGIRMRGAHLNGYTGNGSECRMWVARRAANKPIDPSMLDNLVGGGVALGLSPQQTILKECGEEAGIPPALAKRAKAKSAVTMLREVAEGVQWETLYAFDLRLDADFVPVNQDGEVAEFQLTPIKEVRRLVRDTSEFTVDAALVTLDFMLRHEMSATSTTEAASLIAALRATNQPPP